MSISTNSTSKVSSETGSGHPWQAWALPLFGLLAVLILQVHYFMAGCQDAVLYRDEANDLWTAQAPWGALWHQFIADWDPYVWILALRVWVVLLGSSELTVRALCCVAAVGSTLLLYRAGRRWFGDTPSALALAALVGLGAPLLQVSISYARPYAFALLTSAWVFERYASLAPGRGWRPWALFGLAAFFFSNIQPVNFGLATALALAWVYRQSGGWKAAPRAALIHACLLPSILFVTALPNIIQSARVAAIDTGLGRISADVFGVAYFGKLMVRFISDVTPFAVDVVSYAADDNLSGGLRSLVFDLPWDIRILAVLLALGLLAMVGRGCRRDPGTSKCVEALILFVVTGLFLGLAGFANDRMIVSFRSYSAIALGAALCMVTVLRVWRPLLGLLLVLTFFRAAVGLAFFSERGTGRRSDAKDAAAFIRVFAQEDDLIVLANPAIGPSFSYYYTGPGRQIHHPYEHQAKYWNDVALWRHEAETWRTERTLGRMRHAEEKGRRVWFVWGGAELPQPAEEWHRFYCPDLYVAATNLLAEDFVMFTNRSFETTMEPFRVALFQPAKKAQDSQAQ